MLMEFPYLSSTNVSLRGIFWLYTSKDGSGASLADLLDLGVLFFFYVETNTLEMDIDSIYVLHYQIIEISVSFIQNLNQFSSIGVSNTIIKS